ncbi:TPA_asm: hypothetical protein [Physarum slime mold MELD virus]|nr:TPA_asm: hypothetical protein [Physarum slime mold MELD virus]
MSTFCTRRSIIKKEVCPLSFSFVIGSYTFLEKMPHKSLFFLLFVILECIVGKFTNTQLVMLPNFTISNFLFFYENQIVFGLDASDQLHYCACTNRHNSSAGTRSGV